MTEDTGPDDGPDARSDDHPDTHPDAGPDMDTAPVDLPPAQDAPPGGGMSGPGAGLGATGRTADTFSPGDDVRTDYGDPGGAGTAAEEETA